MTRPTQPPSVDCGNCFEPTLASDGTYLYLTAGNHEELLRMSPNGTWDVLSGPPEEEPALEEEGDVFVQVDAAGRLWWHALTGEDTTARRVHVARSDDQGATWAVNEVLSWGPAGSQAGGAADRNWLVVDGDRALAFCTCPVAAMPQVRVSEDAGQTWGPAAPILEAAGRPGPLGPPVGAEGTIVAPFLVGAFASPGGTLPSALAVAAVVSDDGGATWERVEVAGPADAVADSGTACCAFPNSAVTPEGFVVTWAAGNGQLLVAASPDGRAWELERRQAAAVYPHPWPVWANGSVAVAWSDAGRTVHVHHGANMAVGEASMLPGDYMTAVVHRGYIVSAFPVEGGLALGSVPL